MPYTTQSDRDPMIPGLEEAAQYIYTPGDLTYAITLLMHLRTKAVGLRYSKMSAVRASIQTGVKQEINLWRIQNEHEGQ